MGKQISGRHGMGGDFVLCPECGTEYDRSKGGCYWCADMRKAGFDPEAVYSSDDQELVDRAEAATRNIKAG